MSTELPAVAVLVEPRSADLFAMATSAHGVCRLVWAADLADPATAARQRALARFGPVVDLHGRRGTEVAAELRDLGVAGVVTFTDPPLRYAAGLAQELGLPFHSPATAALLTDKAAQRDRLAAAGVPSAAHVLVPHGSAVPPGVPLPAVVKPRRGAGSRGVSYAADDRGVRAAVAAAGEDVLVEEWLPDLTPPGSRTPRADVVSVEVALQGSDAVVAGTTQRWPLEPPFRETGSFVPAGLPDDVEAELADVALRAVRALDLTSGFAHVELKRTPAGVRVIEVNGRLGGLVADYHRRAGGADLFAAALGLALGAAPPPPVVPERVAYLLWIYAPPDVAVVSAVDGLEQVAAMPGIDDASVDRGPGSSTDPTLGNDSHVVAVSGTAPDAATAAALRAGILRAVTIR